MKILVLDNYDSFVYNLVHYIRQLGFTDITVARNNKISIEEVAQYDKILLSPGPGIPEEAGIMMELIKVYGPSKSILGVCLGHQAIGEVYGCSLENMKEVLHGIETKMNVVQDDILYGGLPKQFNVGRYHSWRIKKDTLGDAFILTAEDEEGSVLGIRHKEFDIAGVQYHPESVLTEHGLKIVENWLKN